MKKFEASDHVKKVSDTVDHWGLPKSYDTLRNSRLENSIIETFNAHVVNSTAKFEFLLALPG